MDDVTIASQENLYAAVTGSATSIYSVLATKSDTSAQGNGDNMA